MRALLLILVACGSSAPPPSASPAAPPAAPPDAAPAPESKDRAIVYGPPELAERAPQPAAPPTPPPPPVHDRLRDAEGPVAGLPGFAIKRTPSTSHCGGIKLSIKRSKRVAPADKHLAAVYALEFPSGLDFDPENKKVRDASMKKFESFIGNLTTTGTAAGQFYMDQVKDADERTKLINVARVVQVQFRVVSILARGEIPKDVRTGEFKDEKIAVYCEKLSEVAAPLLERAETALQHCATFVKQSASTGWWNEVCGSK